MDISKKALIIILIIAIAITAFAVAVIANLGGLGTKLAGVGGPFATGLYKLFNGIPLWISGGGWPTLLVGILVFIVIIPCSVAYITWHYDVPYKITGTTAPINGYGNNTVQREPEEPETITPTGSAIA